MSQDAGSGMTVALLSPVLADYMSEDFGLGCIPDDDMQNG